MLELFQYSFMQNALIAILLASLIGGIMGYLILLRRLAFAAHGLGHISFTGAALALLLKISPILGQFFSTLSAGFLMGLSGRKAQDIATAIILSLMLGLGMLFLHFYTGSANTATSLLFGDVLGVSMLEIRWMVAASTMILLVLMLILRPLVFLTISPQFAEAKGVPSKALNIIFMLLVAISVTLVSQIVGSLLVFVLLVGPSAISLNLTHRFWPGLIASTLIAMLSSILSLVLAFYWNFPVSVCLTGLVAIMYFSSFILRKTCVKILVQS